MNQNFTNLVIFADGGSRGNPGKAASGFVIYKIQPDSSFSNQNNFTGALGRLPFYQELFTDKIAENGEFLNIATNNQAEWQSVILALETTLELGFEKENLIVTVLMDSLLVVQQAKGIYKIKNTGLIPLANKFKLLAKNFQKIDFYHIYREHNKEADALVNQVLDNPPVFLT